MLLMLREQQLDLSERFCESEARRVAPGSQQSELTHPRLHHKAVVAREAVRYVLRGKKSRETTRWLVRDANRHSLSVSQSVKMNQRGANSRIPASVFHCSASSRITQINILKRFTYSCLYILGFFSFLSSCDCVVPSEAKTYRPG